MPPVKVLSLPARQSQQMTLRMTFHFDLDLSHPAKRTNLDGYNIPGPEIFVGCKSRSCALRCLLEPLSSNQSSRSYRRTNVGLSIQNDAVHLWGARSRSLALTNHSLLISRFQQNLLFTSLIECAAKREFANRCLPRMYQDWFAPGYNAHPAAVFHMMEVKKNQHYWISIETCAHVIAILLKPYSISGGGGSFHRWRNPQPILVQSRRSHWKGAHIVEIRFRTGECVFTS